MCQKSVVSLVSKSKPNRFTIVSFLPRYFPRACPSSTYCFVHLTPTTPFISKVEHFRYKSAEDIKKSVKPNSESTEEPERKRAKLTLKGRAAVDPDTGCEETHHILETNGKVYNAILSASDVSTGKNSYYKLQLLEGDWVAAKPNVTGSRKTKLAGSGSASHYVFRSWGRVGTTIGDSRLERCPDKESAIEHFERLFLEKTGNVFGVLPMVKVHGDVPWIMC